MKTSLTILLAIVSAISVVAQDSVKVADSTKRFSQRLAEVTVTARKPLMTLSADKTTVDVKSMITAGNNTLELLEKIPGVTVDPNGDISLNGRGGVLVLIDGRANYMSSQDLSAYLKSIPAGNIDKIELIDNPSAKYDAAGGAVINIRLRKNRNAGFTGNISTGFQQGTFFRTNNSLNLNYSYKKLNVFANVGQAKVKEYDKDLYDRKFFDANDNLISSVHLNNYQLYRPRTFNIYTGLDYALSRKTSVGASFNYNVGRRTGEFDFQSNSFDEQAQSLSSSSGYTNNIEKRDNISYNINLSHRFDDKGQELTADVNYLNHSSANNRLQGNLVVDKNQDIIKDETFQYVVPVTSAILVFKSDYVKPVTKTLRIEAGIKASVIDNNNISNYFDLMNTPPVFVAKNSNHFRYKENINAAYVSVQKTISRLQAQFGLRTENLHATGRQFGNDSVKQVMFTKNNTGLFPSAFILYKLDTVNKNSISLIAVRRINRPNYFQLNPFLFQKDEYTYTSGNPDLNPQFQYRLEIKFQHKQLFWAGLSYNKFSRVIFDVTDADGDKYINRPDNIGRGFMLLLNTGITISPSRWWNLNYVVRVSHMGIRGDVERSQLRPTTQVVRFESYNHFTISKTIGAELGGYYASRDLNGQSITKQMFRVNANVQKRLFQERASLRLGIDDIFHSWRYRNTSVGIPGSSFYQTRIMDTQRFNVGFSYRFGKDTNSRKRRQDNASDEEKGRLE